MLSAASEHQFHLTLASGFQWHFSATEPALEWLQDFARIMELDQSCRPSEKCQEFVVMDGDSFKAWREGACRPAEPFRGLFPLASSWQFVPQGGAYCVLYDGESSPGVLLLNHRLLEQHEIRIINMSAATRMLFRNEALRGGLPFHAALMELDGEAVLVAAAGSVGKSTCSRRLPRPWKARGDDLALLSPVPTGAEGQGYKANVLPTWSEYLWHRSDKTWDTAGSVPVRAIFFLEQGSSDQVESIHSTLVAANRCFVSAKEAMGSYLHKVDLEERRRVHHSLFKNCFDLAGKVRCFKLTASLTGRFWEKIEDVL